MYDIIILGGGAAGLCAANYAAQKNKNLKIAVLEALDRVGKKLIVTGNGQCNITNNNCAPLHYHGTAAHLFNNIILKHPVSSAVNFFEKTGVQIVFENDGRAYPESYQASSVVDALRFSAEENGIQIITDCLVTDFKVDKNITVYSKKGEFSAKKLIIAAGMYSGGDKIGSTGLIFELLTKKGLRATPPKPAIVQLKTDNTLTKSLKGIKVTAKATLKTANANISSALGEVLFTEYGLSGPAIMQISRDAQAESSVIVDLMPNINSEQLNKLLVNRRCNLANRTAGDFLTGMLNKRVGQAIVKKCGINFGALCRNIGDSELFHIAVLIKNLEFKVCGNMGFNFSQVTAGGIASTELNAETLEIYRYKGVYLVGEIVDIDGDCGGYNLQWAWSSAMHAVDNLLVSLEENK